MQGFWIDRARTSTGLGDLTFWIDDFKSSKRGWACTQNSFNPKSKIQNPKFIVRDKLWQELPYGRDFASVLGIKNSILKFPTHYILMLASVRH
jgi:hypothetical protein